MNSAVESFKLDRVMDKYEFRSLNDGIKRKYILHLIRKYNARQIDIADMYYSFFNSSVETRNPNAVLIGTKFGFLNCGGRYKTRIQRPIC